MMRIFLSAFLLAGCGHGPIQNPVAPTTAVDDHHESPEIPQQTPGPDHSPARLECGGVSVEIYRDSIEWFQAPHMNRVFADVRAADGLSVQVELVSFENNVPYDSSGWIVLAGGSRVTLETTYPPVFVPATPLDPATPNDRRAAVRCNDGSGNQDITKQRE